MKSTGQIISNPAVAAVFANYPPKTRRRLRELRNLILETATSSPEIGPIEETLRWGQPSFLTRRTKSGTTIRIDRVGSDDTSFAVFFHCQTTLVESFRRRFGQLFQYEGNRALVFSVGDDLPTEALRECLFAALTYHLNKIRKRRAQPIRRAIK